MTPQQFAALEGALICIALSGLILATAIYLAIHLRRAWYWERFCRVNGGEDKALTALEFTEACHREDTDARIGRGFNVAHRHGYLPEDLQ